MRQIRSLGSRIQGDLRRALVDYRRLPTSLESMDRGGLTARQRNVERARTDSLGPRHDLLDAAKALSLVNADAAALRRAGATVPGLAADTKALSADLARLQALSGLVGQSTQSMNAMGRFARLAESHKMALLTGHKPAAPTMRGMLSAIRQAGRDMRALADAADPFVRVLRAFVVLGQQGIGRLASGRLLPWQAIALEARGLALGEALTHALPGFQERVAAQLANVDRLAMAIAARLTASGASGLEPPSATSAQGRGGHSGAHKRPA